MGDLIVGCLVLAVVVYASWKFLKAFFTAMFGPRR